MISVAPRRLRAILLWLATTAFLVFLLAWTPPARRVLHKSEQNPQFDTDQPPDSEIAIPKSIWQIFYPPRGTTIIKEGYLHSNDWIEMAPGYTYTLVGTLEAETFLAEHFSHRPEIAATYHALNNFGSRSDFLRYLILYVYGGIYSDIDTKPIVPLNAWLPPQRRRDVHLLVALEHDEVVDSQPEDFVYPVQFCQWTIAAAPNHTVFARMIDRMLVSLHDVAKRQGTPLDRAKFRDFDVVNTTGPVAWTEVVLGVLQDMNEGFDSYGDLVNTKTTRYFGDVAVLPLSGFRAEWYDEWGLSWEKERRPLVRHFFKGGWKKEA
ncbi:nucleotide-diphospho-sugar transferase [Podospora aff. communis PSN243]|uniref:Nucleotide-diphospho-sugar transferase n=1 Tax=Podospora aff. communis PSN243 TaxID=3040156 RepID=A0AAV9H234_9PEZI|nr:nucleotide-diphospho-sugar transferase [Podospora aff. communis PSN243]